MLGIWIRLMIVITLYHQLAVHGLRAFEEAWAAKCNDSGFEGYNATIDFQKYNEYRQCMSTTFNETQFNGDLEAILKDLLNSPKPEYATIGTALQKHCAPAKAQLKCSEKISTECFTEEEIFRWNIQWSLENAVIDFFCENGTAGMTEFINGNGLECYSARNVSIKACITESDIQKTTVALLTKDVFAMFHGVPKADMLCDITRRSFNCILQSFQRCEKPTEPVRLIAKLISYVDTETKCAIQPKVDSLAVIKQSDLWQRYIEFENTNRT